MARLPGDEPGPDDGPERRPPEKIISRALLVIGLLLMLYVCIVISRAL